MYIKNKFLLIVLLAQPFTLMGGEVPSPPAGTSNKVTTGLYILAGSLGAIVSGLNIYDHFQKIFLLNPLQKKTAEAELQLKYQQLESNSVRKDTAKAELQLRQQQLINAQTQGLLYHIQSMKDAHELQEKTGNEPDKLDTEEVMKKELTKIWEKINKFSETPQPTQSNQLLLSQSPKHTPEEQEEEIKRLAQNTPLS